MASLFIVIPVQGETTQSKRYAARFPVQRETTQSKRYAARFPVQGGTTQSKRYAARENVSSKAKMSLICVALAASLAAPTHTCNCSSCTTRFMRKYKLTKALLFIPYARKFAFRLYLYRTSNCAAYHCGDVAFALFFIFRATAMHNKISYENKSS